MDDNTLNEKFENFELVAIPDFTGYFVSVDGEVYSDRKGKWKELKPFLSSRNRYYAVELYINKKRYIKSIHRIVAETFLENKDKNKTQVDHINRNKLDNRLENLRWVTSSENTRNMPKPVTNKSGVKGVYFHIRRNMWDAFWYDFNGKQKSKSFSIKKYGDKAKQLAIDFRKKMEKIYYPTLTTF